MKNGYAAYGVNHKTIYLQRQILKINKQSKIKFKNANILDCRRSNLYKANKSLKKKFLLIKQAQATKLKKQKLYINRVPKIKVKSYFIIADKKKFRFYVNVDGHAYYMGMIKKLSEGRQIIKILDDRIS